MDSTYRHTSAAYNGIIMNKNNTTATHVLNTNSPNSDQSSGKGLKWAIKINDWCTRHIPVHAHLILLAILIGAVTGVASYFFRMFIGKVAGLFIPHISHTDINWWLIILPVIGILITGIFTRYIVRTNLTHGSAKLIHDLRDKLYRLKHNLTFSSIVGGTITLGMGGSSGSEGPIAYTGAAIGSNIGQMFGVPYQRLKVLIGCGAAAGIAAVFMAPIGGLMYALELLCINISVFSVIAVTTSCLTAYIVVYLLRDSHSYFHFDFVPSFDNSLIPMAICLGIFCGLYSIYYTASVNRMDSVFRHIRNPWISNIIGGLTVGFIVLLFPSMFSIGYPIIQNMVDGNSDALANGSVLGLKGVSETTLIYTAIGILLLKGWAVSATNSSGGVGGDFAPTLFAGGMAGFLFASLSNMFFHTAVPVPLFTFLGMAAVMAGAIRTPLMAIFIVMEFSKAYDFALPISICAITSYLTVRFGDIWIGKGVSVVRHIHWFERKISD